MPHADHITTTWNFECCPKIAPAVSVFTVAHLFLAIIEIKYSSFVEITQL
jgi:hypothetical protein